MAKAIYKNGEEFKNAHEKLPNFRFRQMKSGKVLVDLRNKKGDKKKVK